MRFTLKTRIVALTILTGVLPIAAVLALIWNLQGEVATRTRDELDALARQDATQIARSLYRMCRIAEDQMQGRIELGCRMAGWMTARLGDVGLDGPTNEWAVPDPGSGAAQTVALPGLRIGASGIVPNADPSTRTPVVDDVRDASGLDCAVLQRMNEAGDLLRAATTVVGTNGARAIGTRLPAERPDGAADPVIAALLEGKPAHARVQVAGEPYLAAYQPLTNAAGRMLGAVAVGIKVREASGLRGAFLATRVGRTGYAWVMGCSGNQRGVYLVSRDGKQDGVSVWDRTDEGRRVVQEIIAAATARPEGEIGCLRYTWTDPGDPAPRRVVSAFTSFKPWDWVIGITTYEDEYLAARENIEQSTRTLMFSVCVAGSILLLLTVMLAVSQGSRIVQPLRSVIQVAQAIASGDLGAARQAGLQRQTEAGGPGRGRRQAEDIRQLLVAFGTMADSLVSLVGQVQRSGIQVTASATRIAASARELEATVAEQAASTRQVKDTARDIVSTSQALESTMRGVDRTAGETVSTAETGRAVLDRMASVMRQLTDATASIAARLGVISDKATRISRVVTAINKISDQTNLLSLNAAIEAEKAGEHGRGFSVVAREISRLADQTALATQDIEQVVKEMQSAVSSGVMEMDKFADEVRRGVSEVRSVAEQLGAIIDQVKALAPEFSAVGSGMQTQVQGAQQISESMEQLAQAAEQTRASLTEFKQATEQLNEAVQHLRGEVSRFKLGPAAG